MSMEVKLMTEETDEEMIDIEDDNNNINNDIQTFEEMSKMIENMPREKFVKLIQYNLLFE